MRDAETESHEGKRKTESLWPIFRVSNSSLLNSYKNLFFLSHVCIFNSLIPPLYLVFPTYLIPLISDQSSKVSVYLRSLLQEGGNQQGTV